MSTGSSAAGDHFDGATNGPWAVKDSSRLHAFATMGDAPSLAQASMPPSLFMGGVQDKQAVKPVGGPDGLFTGCSTTGDHFDGTTHSICGPRDGLRLHVHRDDRNLPPDVPHERAEVPLPPYVIEAPDVLEVDALRLVPKPPYKISPLDIIGIQVVPSLPDAPIDRLFTVEPDGTVNLGYSYGKVLVVGMTLDEAKAAITKYLTPKPGKEEPGKIKPPFEVTVVLGESRGLQQIRGPHLVRVDGTIGLGVYGSVFVDGMTIEDARAAIENHLAQFILKPEISLDVSGFNSKVYYVITEGAGPGGTQVVRLPITGKMTVLDALSYVNGLSIVSSKKRIYLVRPLAGAHCPDGPEEVYHVDWHGVAGHGDVTTNYQVLPGDRIYVKAAPLVVTDTYLALFLAPFERIFGTVGLGNSTVRQFLFPIPKNVNNAFSLGF
jgi:polysaccharide export outer membrane protein